MITVNLHDKVKIISLTKGYKYPRVRVSSITILRESGIHIFLLFQNGGHLCFMYVPKISFPYHRVVMGR